MYFSVWFKVKLHVKDAKTIMDKKKYVAFWLERYVKREPGMPLTVVFDMSESGLSNIVSVRVISAPFPDSRSGRTDRCVRGLKCVRGLRYRLKGIHLLICKHF